MATLDLVPYAPDVPVDGLQIRLGTLRSVGRTLQVWDRVVWRWVKLGEVAELDDDGVLYWDDVYCGGIHVGYAALEHVAQDGVLHRRLVYAPGTGWPVAA